MSSGKTSNIVWVNETHYNHWGNKAGNWLGTWNVTAQQYDDINTENIERSLNVTEGLLVRWG